MDRPAGLAGEARVGWARPRRRRSGGARAPANRRNLARARRAPARLLLALAVLRPLAREPALVRRRDPLVVRGPDRRVHAARGGAAGDPRVDLLDAALAVAAARLALALLALGGRGDVGGQQGGGGQEEVEQVVRRVDREQVEDLVAV